MKIKMIAACDAFDGIGLNNSIPWRLPSDMKRFRELTTGSHVVMGSNTWRSLPSQFRPLPGRSNFVLSRQYKHKNEVDSAVHEFKGARCWGSFDNFIKAYIRGTDGVDNRMDLWVIGGASLYELAMPFAHELHLTRVPGNHGCDTFFPNVPPYLQRRHRYFLDDHEYHVYLSI